MGGMLLASAMEQHTVVMSLDLSKATSLPKAKTKAKHNKHSKKILATSLQVILLLCS